MAQAFGEDPAVLHRKAQDRVLVSLAPGEDDVFELLGALAAYDVRHHVAPDAALPGGRPLPLGDDGPVHAGGEHDGRLTMP